MAYTSEDQAALLLELEAAGEPGYREFTEKLTPGLGKSYGVRMGEVRRIAKRLASGDFRGYIACAGTDSYEERLILGLVIGTAKCPIDERLIYAERFVPYIDNWAVCDTFCSSTKAVRKERAKTLSFLDGYAGSDKEFELRFYAVMLMDHFIYDGYIDETLYRLAAIRHDGYYVKMGVAWAIAECFIKYRDKTLPVLESGALDRVTGNKAIQKICDSFRVSEADKALIKTFRDK